MFLMDSAQVLGIGRAKSLVFQVMLLKWHWPIQFGTKSKLLIGEVIYLKSAVH